MFKNLFQFLYVFDIVNELHLNEIILGKIF